jgi:hypothetical protein
MVLILSYLYDSNIVLFFSRAFWFVLLIFDSYGKFNFDLWCFGLIIEQSVWIDDDSSLLEEHPWVW